MVLMSTELLPQNKKLVANLFPYERYDDLFTRDIIKDSQVTRA